MCSSDTAALVRHWTVCMPAFKGLTTTQECQFLTGHYEDAFCGRCSVLRHTVRHSTQPHDGLPVDRW